MQIRYQEWRARPLGHGPQVSRNSIPNSLLTNLMLNTRPYDSLRSATAPFRIVRLLNLRIIAFLAPRLGGDASLQQRFRVFLAQKQFVTVNISQINMPLLRSEIGAPSGGQK